MGLEAPNLEASSSIDPSDSKIRRFAEENEKQCMFWNTFMVSFIAVMWLGLKFVAIVDPGHTGVVKLFGAVQEYTYPSGMHMKNFFAEVIPVDNRIYAASYRTEASSEDLQLIVASVTAQYNIMPNVSSKLYRNIGKRENIEEAVINPAIQESIKAAMANYTCERMITERNAVKDAIVFGLNKHIDATLSSKSCEGGIKISNLAIMNFTFSIEFEAAIESKVKAEQAALQAINEKNMLITNSEADKAVQELLADAEAYRTLTESYARAKSIEYEAAAIKTEPNYLLLKAVEKWDGYVPEFYGGENVPMLDFDEIANLTVSS